MDDYTIFFTATPEDEAVLFFVFCSDSLAKLTQGQLERLSQDSCISCFLKNMVQSESLNTQTSSMWVGCQLYRVFKVQVVRNVSEFGLATIKMIQSLLIYLLKNIACKTYDSIQQ